VSLWSRSLLFSFFHTVVAKSELLVLSLYRLCKIVTLVVSSVWLTLVIRNLTYPGTFLPFPDDHEFRDCLFRTEGVQGAVLVVLGVVRLCAVFKVTGPVDCTPSRLLLILGTLNSRLIRERSSWLAFLEPGIWLLLPLGRLTPVYVFFSRLPVFVFCLMSLPFASSQRLYQHFPFC